MLGQLAHPDRTVVADFEAGLGTVLRLTHDPADPVRVDVVVVVVEPTAKSLEVGRRAVQAVQEAGLGRLVVSANRIRDDQDAGRARDAFPGLDLVLVPDDAAVVAADREGRAPLDVAPDAPAVQALVALCESLLTPR